MYIVYELRKGRFLNNSNHWEDEYPGARLFLTKREANERKQAMTRAGYRACVVKDYGLETEERSY